MDREHGVLGMSELDMDISGVMEAAKRYASAEYTHATLEACGERWKELERAIQRAAIQYRRDGIGECYEQWNDGMIDESIGDCKSQWEDFERSLRGWARPANPYQPCPACRELVACDALLAELEDASGGARE